MKKRQSAYKASNFLTIQFGYDDYRSNNRHFLLSGREQQLMFGQRSIAFEVASDRDFIYEDSRQHSFFSSDVHSYHNPQQSRQVAKVPMGLAVEDYPLEFSQANPFCPLCTKFVSKNEPFLTFHSVHRRKKYMFHSDCAGKQNGRCLVMSQSGQAKLQSVAFLNQMRSIALGGQEFYFQIEVTHPLGGASLAKLWTKLKSIGNFVTWDIKAQTEADYYSPNIVAFPLPDFQLTINLIEIGQKQGKLTKKAVISVSRLGGNEVQFVKAYVADLQITMRVIGNKEEQARTIDQMNIKYRYPLQTGTPLVEIVRVQVRLPAGESDDDEDIDESRRNSSIPELSSEKYSHRDIKSINSQALSERSFDKQKVDLQKLVSSEKLGQFVRQNTQSRVFQSWLGEATPREVDEVISALWQEFPDLITHEYANYMIQKLIGVCSLAQRLRIVQRLQADIPGIARNKQGTHSLQTLITLFTTDDEYKLVIDSIKTSFLTLAQHPNATHFLQKIISLFPITLTSHFMELVAQDFLSFALDKHAMCVIKQMIKKISDAQANQTEGGVHEIRKRFTHTVNFNIDRLITDPYGNYIIQFCYEFFGEDKCAAITERIIDRILQFSLQKYSSAVVFKCVGSYWSQKDTLNRLKNALSNEIIYEMFRNRDANKILLQLVEKNEGSSLRQKIQSQLMLNEPTKFNHDRWGVALGSRSGTVGTGWTCFSDAVKKPAKKKKYYNNLH